MKAIPNKTRLVSNKGLAVVNIVKSKNERNSQQRSFATLTMDKLTLTITIKRQYCPVEGTDTSFSHGYMQPFQGCKNGLYLVLAICDSAGVEPRQATDYSYTISHTINMTIAKIDLGEVIYF